MGYGIVAVPTGIFSMELRQVAKSERGAGLPELRDLGIGCAGAILPIVLTAFPGKLTELAALACRFLLHC
jgi:hypothetical protein